MKISTSTACNITFIYHNVFSTHRLSCYALFFMAEVQLCAENWRRLIRLDQSNLLVGHRISLQLSTNLLLCWVHVERLSSCFLPFSPLPLTSDLCPYVSCLSVILSLSLSFAIFSFHICILVHSVLSCISFFLYLCFFFGRKDKDTLRKLTTETASLVC